jgi:aspartate ammonia-lyase
MRELVDRSTVVATALSPYLGYALTAELAKESLATGKTIRDLIVDKQIFKPEEVDAILDAREQTQPGIAGGMRFKPRLPPGYEPPTGPASG